MRNKFIASFAVLTLALAGALSISVQAQTTQEGPGPSEQPSAPMEIGQIKPAQPAQASANAETARGSTARWTVGRSRRPRLTRVWAASA